VTQVSYASDAAAAAPVPDTASPRRFGRLASAVPPSVPFMAPEALERARGSAFTLRLGANESAFGPSPLALEAAARALPESAWYPDPESDALRAGLAASTGVAPDQIVIGSGIDDLLGLAVRSIMDAGDVAVAATGTYPTFGYQVRAFGGRLDTVPYAPDFSVDLEGLRRRAEEIGARAVYVANPDNPTGTHHGEEALRELLAGLPPGCTLLLDEAYADFVEPTEASLAPADAPLLRFRTFSKGYGLAGMRVGYIVAPREYISVFHKVRVHFGVSRDSQAAALAALDDHAHLRYVVEEVGAERPGYAAVGEAIGWRALPSSTNFVAFDAGDEATAAWWLDTLAAQGVFVRRGSVAPVDRLVRVTVGTSRERAQLAAIVTRIAVERERAGARKEHR
jgi:histidinol-phosphate aminotransferase